LFNAQPQARASRHSEKGNAAAGNSRTAAFPAAHGVVASLSPLAERRQNAVLNGQKVGLAPLCPPQHQQKIVYVPIRPIRL